MRYQVERIIVSPVNVLQHQHRGRSGIFTGIATPAVASRTQRRKKAAQTLKDLMPGLLGVLRQPLILPAGGKIEPEELAHSLSLDFGSFPADQGPQPPRELLPANPHPI